MFYNCFFFSFFFVSSHRETEWKSEKLMREGRRIGEGRGCEGKRRRMNKLRGER
jgi:hypothetical protein